MPGLLARSGNPAASQGSCPSLPGKTPARNASPRPCLTPSTRRRSSCELVGALLELTIRELFLSHDQGRGVRTALRVPGDPLLKQFLHFAPCANACAKAIVV